MMFDKGLTNLINFVRNMSDSDKNKLKVMATKINQLDNKNKAKLFQSLCHEFDREFNKITICNQKGHKFSKWEHYVQYVSEIDMILNTESELSNECWKRICLNCGCEEITYKNPSRYKQIILKKGLKSIDK